MNIGRVEIGFPKPLLFQYLLATSSCLFAYFGGELQLAGLMTASWSSPLWTAYQQELVANIPFFKQDFRSFPSHAEGNF